MGLSSFFRSKPPDAEDTEGAYASRAETELDPTRARARRKSSKQSSQPVDPVLPEKKRARRRLVGAIALVLAAVIGLPMVLDSEPKPLAEDLVIQIPSKDQPAVPSPRRRVVSDAVAVVPADTALDQREEVIDAVPVTGRSTAPAATVSEKVVDATKPAQPALAQSQSSMKTTPAAKNEARSVSTTAPKAADRKSAAESARARAILTDAAPSDATESAVAPDHKDSKDAKPAHLMVQVAALASKEKVAELQGKLKAAGIVSHTETIATDSGARIRVRIGPFGSHQDADKARARLSAMGLGGTVVPG